MSGMTDHTRLPGAGFDLSRSRHLFDHLIYLRLCGLSDRTLYARRRGVVLLAEFLGADPVDALLEDLERWQVHLLQTSVNLVRWMTTVVRPYFTWLHRRGLRTDNPAALLPLPRKRRGLPRPMAEIKVEAMIAGARPRLRPWLLLAGWSGLRAGEIAGLRVEHFYLDEHGETWVRVLGKGDVERDAPVPSWAWPLIAAEFPPGATSGRCWRRERGRGPVLPVHVSQMCNRYLHAIGIPDTLHSLRHRVATQAYDATGDLRMVADLMGHASTSTTQVYTRVSPHRMSAAVNALPRPAALPGTPGRRLHLVDPRTQESTA